MKVKEKMEKTGMTKGKEECKREKREREKRRKMKASMMLGGHMQSKEQRLTASKFCLPKTIAGVGVSKI